MTRDTRLKTTGEEVRDEMIRLNAAKQPYVQRIDELKAEVRRLRGALEAVEWVESDNGALGCPWCRRPPPHKPDCARQAALEPTP